MCNDTIREKCCTPGPFVACRWLMALLLGMFFVLSCAPDNAAATNHAAWSIVTEQGVELMYARQAGTGWTEPLRPGGKQGVHLTPALASDSWGDVWVVWIERRSAEEYLLRYCQIQDDVVVVSGTVPSVTARNYAPTLLVDGDDTPWVAWSGYDGEDEEIYFSRWTGASWSAPSMVHADNSTPDTLPVLGMERNGVPWLRWTKQLLGRPVLYMAIWEGTAWSTPVRTARTWHDRLTALPAMPEQSAGRLMGSLHVPGDAPMQSWTDRGRTMGRGFPPLAQGPSVRESSVTTVVGFGDSITTGTPYIPSSTWEGNGCRCATNSDCCGGYETTLENWLQYQDKNVTVLNYGIPGEMSSNGAERLASVLAAARPSHVLLLEGTNDLWWVDVNTVAGYLLEMVRQVRAVAAIPILATLTPDSRADASVKAIDELNNLIRWIGRQYRVVICDQDGATAADWENLNADGLHPDANGYVVMASAWYKTLVGADYTIRIDAKELGSVDGDGVSPQPGKARTNQVIGSRVGEPK